MFSAAVHYVNAYVWEVRQIEPRNHDERLAMVALTSALKRADASYARLQQHGFSARYRLTYRPDRDIVGDLIETDLEAVRVAVLWDLDMDSA